MKYKIVADSACNIVSGEDGTFASVPMKIVAEREYVVDANLDVAQMVEDLKQYKGKSGSSCPNVGEWLEAFGDAEEVFGITISKHLSGSYNAARHAADTYMAEQKIRQCEDAGDDFESTKEKVLDYHNHLHTLFCLESMNNLARNGRVNIAVAKIAGMLGIRVAGEAKGGQVAPVHKPRGLRKTTQMLVDMVKERGFRDGGYIRVAHCFAEEAAADFREALLAEFPNARFMLEPTTALCSYYAEVGGLIIGFEGAFNTHNDNRLF